VHNIFGKLAFVVAVGCALAEARGCDLCGCYTPQLEALPQFSAESVLGPPPSPKGGDNFLSHTYFAVAEQFTYFGTLQLDGDEVSNPTGQYENSSIAQLVAGYSVNSRFALQLNLPVIYRWYRRPNGFAIEHGTESGLGDISLLGNFVLFHFKSGGSREVNFDDPKNPRIEIHEPDFTASAILTGGVKFPTGDTSRLKEEFNEVEIPGAPESGIHGHDLTLGTGSYDAIMGGQGSLRYHSFFFDAEIQFTLRGDGAHQYHFANDLTWSAGPGYFFIRKPSTIVGVQLVTSGEYKDVDRFRGDVAADTGITSVFLGPRVIASLGNWSAEIQADFPVHIQNTALQIVPDYRLQASVSLHF
jgi:hypothetical protein